MWWVQFHNLVLRTNSQHHRFSLILRADSHFKSSDWLQLDNWSLISISSLTIISRCPKTSTPKCLSNFQGINVKLWPRDCIHTKCGQKMAILQSVSPQSISIKKLGLLIYKPSNRDKTEASRIYTRNLWGNVTLPDPQYLY